MDKSHKLPGETVNYYHQITSI